MGHIKAIRLAPFTPPFPRWYNARAQCDYHGGNPGHPTKNCTALKYKIHDLVNEGKLKFEDLDGSVEIKTRLGQMWNAETRGRDPKGSKF